LIAGGFGDVVLVGSNHSSDTLRIKEFLTRNAHPYSAIDPDTDRDVQHLLDRFQFSIEEIPVLICRGRTVLRNPTNREIADCLGFNDSVDQTHARDVVIVGAGPSGLAAAVYAASEGLDVLVLESNAPGGQAGSSSRIENYLGFPSGISGGELTARAYTQAQKFGAEMIIAEGATRLDCTRNAYTIEVDNGPRVPARTVIIATGAEYRKLPLENIGRFEGAGIYYGATFIESQLCEGEEVVVVGGGNSAGQAAVFLARHVSGVDLVVRGRELGAGMSRYLVDQVEASPRIRVHLQTEVRALGGDGALEAVTVQDTSTQTARTLDVAAMFVFIGADPCTGWLQDTLVTDDDGFVVTGDALSLSHLDPAGDGRQRAAYALETSRPGVFAVGDVRSGSIKRVASAVGEGAMAVLLLHQYLALLGAPSPDRPR
jgi:thioredoxin reductase (NADPH)